MPVLIVVDSLELGGSQRIAVTLAGELRDRGHAVALLTLNSPANDHFDVPEGVTRKVLNIYRSPPGPFGRFAAAFHRWRAIRRVVLEHMPTTVIAFGDLVAIRVFLSSPGTRHHLVANERTDPRHRRLSMKWAILRLITYRYSRYLVVQTSSVEAWAKSAVRQEGIRVIPNPVRLVPRYSARPERLARRPTLIGVGRLSHEKGFDLLLSAFAQSDLHCSGWQLVILGDGPQRALLELIAARLGISDSVVLPGAVKNPEAWLQHSEIFVLSSRYEGFPNALLDAIACEIPVIAFSCPSGPAEIIAHERTGLLVPPTDVAGLAEAIVRLAGDECLRQRIVSAATREVADRLNPDRICRHWEDLIADLVPKLPTVE